MFVFFSRYTGIPGQRGPKGKEKKSFPMWFPNCICLIGEPAQALPGFKGEIVSFFKDILYRV